MSCEGRMYTNKKQASRVDPLTWERLVADWDHPTRPYLMDQNHLSGYVGWYCVATLDSIPRTFWEENRPASDLQTGAYWIHQRIPMDAQEVTFMTVSGCVVWGKSGRVEDLLETHPSVFCSRQLAALRFRYQKLTSVEVVSGSGEVSPRDQAERLVPPELVVEEQSDEVVILFFPIVAGPELKDVVFLRGKDRAGPLIHYCDKKYSVAKCPLSREPQEVPLIVQLVWQRSHFQVPSKVDLLSIDYYRTNIVEYSSWSFSLHVRQVRTIVEHIPTKFRLVAPGDGWGVVKRAATRHEVLSTDPSVLVDYQEVLSDTLKRLRPNDILILGYLWSLLTEGERQQVLSQQVPVILIDSRPFISPFHCVGLGLFELRCPPHWFSGSEVPEGFHEPLVLYTENLLRIPKVSDRCMSAAYKYWCTHRVFGEVSEDGDVVCSLLEEAVRFLSYRPFLTSIGRHINIPIKTSVGIGNVQLSSRLVYFVEESSFVVEQIKQRAQWTYANGNFYFCFSFPTTFFIQSRTRDMYCSYKVEVDEIPPLRVYSLELESITPLSFYISQYGGTLIPVTRSPLVDLIFFDLLVGGEMVCLRGWQLSMVGKASKSDWVIERRALLSLKERDIYQSWLKDRFQSSYQSLQSYYHPWWRGIWLTVLYRGVTYDQKWVDRRNLDRTWSQITGRENPFGQDMEQSFALTEIGPLYFDMKDT
jgi:hypothetical protein